MLMTRSLSPFSGSSHNKTIISRKKNSGIMELGKIGLSELLLLNNPGASLVFMHSDQVSSLRRQGNVEI
jgi:hypothetical protein